jgi:Zn-dependent protease with chaperone function
VPDAQLIKVRRTFRLPSWDVIQHPADREALDALKKIPLLDKLIGFLIEQHWERLLYIQNISSSVRITPRQSPRIWYIFNEANRIFSIDEPCELYVMQNPILNAHTFGHKKPYIMLNSAIVDATTDDELLAVIGHEIGHILAGHCLYTTMVQLIRPYVEFGLSNLPGGQFATIALRMALFRWSRASELTGDRFGLLACQDPQTMVKVMMKLAGGKTPDELDPMEFMAQGQAYKELDEKLLDSFYKLMMAMPQTHPLAVIRAQEMMSWAQSRQYLSMMSDSL